MGDEITAEVLAKATNKAIETAQSGTNKLKLEIGGEKVDYVVLDRAGSDADNSFNGIAIAPKMPNGNPDYSNVAVVFAGTNNANLSEADQKSGAGTAIHSLGAELSGEYEPASAFLQNVLTSVEDKGGRVTDVSGFSQSGGYLMKISAVYGQKYGFQSTSFDDFGREQHRTLTSQEQKWLSDNPHMLRRYQNSSWAALSFRDNEYGTVAHVSAYSHDTLAKYFDGDVLNLDRLAKDGHFAPGMTEAQVRRAAKKWVKDNPDGRWATSTQEELDARIKSYLKLYGPYASGKSKGPGGGSSVGKVGLKSGFAASGAALIDTAIAHLEDARRTNNAIPEQLEESYRRILQETSDAFSFILDPSDIEAEAHRLGLQPELHIDRAAIARVSTTITQEIDELKHLKTTLRTVSTGRALLDAQQATKFRA